MKIKIREIKKKLIISIFKNENEILNIENKNLKIKTNILN